MKKKYKVLLFIISVLLTAALASGAVIAAANDVFALCKSGSEKTFALGEETALREGAQKLKEEGIIAFPLLFRIYFFNEVKAVWRCEKSGRASGLLKTSSLKKERN